MARNLRLQVMLNAVDRVTGPLKRMRESTGKTGQAMRETRDQLKELQRQQSDVTSYRKANAALRTNTRAMHDARERNRQYTQALDQQREAHAGIKSGLTVARREYDRLAKELLRTKQPSDQLSASLERARVRLHGQQTEFDRSARAMREYRNRTRNAGEEVKKLTQNHATQTERIRGLKTRLDEAGISTDNLGRSARELRTKEERLNTSLQEQKRHLAEVADRQRRLTQARDRYQNGMGNVARAQGVGMGMFGTGIAQGYAASRLLTPGIAWGEQMSTLQAVGRFGADDERYQALRQQSRDLGGSTAFSATEVGGGQEFLLRAGMSAEAIQSSMRDVLNLALANNTELARAADIASNIAGTFKIDMEAEGAMARVGDILSGTASRANVSLEMLGDTMKYLGGSEDLDLTMEQAAAMAGLMGNIGIQGSMAGTAMRAMANRLTDPAKEGREAMEALGLQVADTSGNMRAMPDILRDLNNATRDLGNVERRAMLSKIFGAEAGSGMTELVNGMSDGMLDELINALQHNAGENARMAEVMADNVGGDLKNLRSAWEEVGISITDTNDGPLRELIQNITSITRGVGDWIKANPELTGTIAKVTAGLIALATVGGAVTMMMASILGPLLFTRFAMANLGIRLGIMTQGFSVMGAVMSGMKAVIAPAVAAFKWLAIAIMFTPIGWIIAGITALAAAGLAIYKYWQPIKAFFIGFWQGLRESMGPVAAEMSAAFSAVLDIFTPFAPVLTGIVDTVKSLWGWFTELIAPVQLTSEQFEEATSAGFAFGEALGNALRFVAELSRILIEFSSSVLQGVGAGLVAVMELIRDWSPGALIGGVFRDGIRQLLVDLPQSFSELGSSIMDGIMSGIDSKVQALRDKVTGVGDFITGIFKRDQEIHSPSRVWAQLGSYTMQGLANGIEGDSDGPLEKVRALSNNLRNAAGGLILGAGLSTGAAANVDTGSLQIDARPPLQSHTSQSSGGLHIHGGINISVQAAPGMDEQALARLVNEQVQRALQQAQQQAAAASRRNFHDND
ncbi:phage tail tape measure protein [Vreelandella sp. V005]|uniref:phage tail tape measure protein n=1 Tax=Vreelandella sp. V005 TaxID=3459608 RepID=UPI004044ACC5